MIVVQRHHDLGLTKARHLAETMAQRLQRDYDGSFIWRGDELHFSRTGVSGWVGVTNDRVEVRVELGFLLRPLRGRIEHEICAFCDEQFAPPTHAPRHEHPREPKSPDRTPPARRPVRRLKD